MSPSAPRGAAGAASPARSPEGVLTPSKEGVLNRTTAHAPAASKVTMRDAMAHLLRSTYIVKPHPPNLHVAPRTLHPLMLLPRQHLPLSCIDAVGSSNELGHSRFFEAQIRILELESRLGSVTNLLIARYEPRGSVYALERQANALYVMCKLGAWVDLDELAGHATAIAEEQFRPARPERPESTVSDAFITPQLHSEQKRKRAAIEEFQSLVKKRARAASSTTTTTTTTANDLARREGTVEPDGSAPQGQSPQVKLEDSFVLETDAKENIPPAGCALPKVAEQEAEALPQHTADDVFGNIRSHYIDALYKSMGSLAYFAKGPLSRARSAFHLDLDSNLDMSDLIDFLKGLVLTTVQIDTKYRQTVPDLISKMKAGFESSDDGRKKKRKSKKMKIGKDALYPAEDESIRKWWTASKAQLMENEAEISSSQIKSHISVLRTRETQLQMILIMEILALEPLRGSADQGEGILPGDTDAQDIGATSQAKKRNKHNLPLLLDVHADRLTIWQSTATDEQILLEDSQSARVSADGSQGKKASSEPLKDFCIDVIVPFFSARLPELCDSITRKLGGPAIIAPAQSKASKQHQAKDQKPGSVTKRSASASSGNPRRTLQRALSTDQQSRRSVSRGPSNAIALLRSATPSLISNVKREINVDLKSLRKLQAIEDPRRSGQLSRSKSLSSLRDPKASRDAEVQAELQEAISAIRKPNRDVVGKALVEADERRSSSLAMKKMRKSAAASSRTSNVQVKATPVNNRFKDMMAPRPPTEPSQNRTSNDIGIDCVPPSSIGPAERTIRPTRLVDETPQKYTHSEEVVGDTPIRQPSFIKRPSSRSTRDIDAAQGRGAHLELDATPGSAVKTSRPARDAFTDRTIGATPVRKPIQRLIFDDRSASQTPDTIPEKRMDLYDRLGWNDDFDDLA